MNSETKNQRTHRRRRRDTSPVGGVDHLLCVDANMKGNTMPKINSLPGWGTMDVLIDIIKAFSLSVTDKTVAACTIPLLQVTSEWDITTGSFVEVTYFGNN